MQALEHARRGGMYVAVLGTALIVAVIGISALTTTRIQLRSAEVATDTIEARFYAQSAIEMALLSLNNDPTWRTTYSHDMWVPEQPIGNGKYTWKLVDERDADLAKDPNQPVRLYGKAVTGGAVRIYSVLLEPPAPPTNLLFNGDMEDGTTHWTGLGDCDLESHSDEPHGGAAYIWVKNRSTYSGGPNQDVTPVIEYGRQYDVEVWVKMMVLPEVVRVHFYLNTSFGPTSVYFEGLAETAWTKVEGTLTPTWGGSLIKAYWEVRSTSSTQEFKVDDAVLIKQKDRPAMIPVRASWRRETLP